MWGQHGELVRLSQVQRGGKMRGYMFKLMAKLVKEKGCSGICYQLNMKLFADASR